MSWMPLLIVGLLDTVPIQMPGPYPQGYSTQEFRGREFDLVIPKDFDRSKTYSLIVVIEKRGKPVAYMFTRLTEDGYIICAPKKKVALEARSWAVSDVKHIIPLVEHLQKELPIGKDRLHAVVVDDSHAIFPFLIFHKRSPFVSACFMDSVYRGGSVPKRAKRELNVLALEGPVCREFDGEKRFRRLRGKVRTFEYRKDGYRPESPYFRYWLDVMDGRYEAGVGLSFDWLKAPEKTKDMAGIKKLVTGKRAGTLIYFYAPSPLEIKNKNGRHLQNVVFFDPMVRELVGRMAAVKLDRRDYDSVFEAFALKETPAVVVLNGGFKATATLQGKIKTSALLKALRQATRSKR